MTEERTVECLDCGHTWDSTAENPRCSKAECGRSRNVEPVGQESEEPEPEEPEPEESEPEESESDDSGGYSPAFEAASADMSGDKRPPGADPSDVEEAIPGAEDGESDSEESEESQLDEGDIPELDPEQLAPAIEATFGAVATTRGEYWRLDEEERDKLAEAWTPVLNHYAPVMVRQHSVVAVALITSAGIVLPRLNEDRERQKRREKEQVDTESNAGNVREERSGTPVERDEPTPEAEENSETTAGGYANV
jgi:hypothetical protein